MRVGGQAPAPIDHAELARELQAARLERREVGRLTDRTPLSEEDAYAIQDEGILLRRADGERVTGGKLGFTSEAMRRAMGVDRPNYGWVTDAMDLADGVVRLNAFIHPKAEPEIAFVLREDLGSDADAAGVLAATDRVVACLEVVDSRYRDFSFRALDNIADDSSAAAFVLGEAISPDRLDLANVAVVMTVDDRPFAEATGAAVMGDPAEAVAWMARAAACPRRPRPPCGRRRPLRWPDATCDAGAGDNRIRDDRRGRDSGDGRGGEVRDADRADRHAGGTRHGEETRADREGDRRRVRSPGREARERPRDHQGDAPGPLRVAGVRRPRGSEALHARDERGSTRPALHRRATSRTRPTGRRSHRSARSTARRSRIVAEGGRSDALERSRRPDGRSTKARGPA